MNVKAIDVYLQKLKKGISQTKIDDADIADYLEDIKRDDEDKFYAFLKHLPIDMRAQTFMELPTTFQIDLILKYEAQGLAEIIEALESDDATDLFIAISKTDKTKEEEVFSLLSDETQETIEQLMSYESNEAGSLMQTEILKVSSSKTISYAIEKLAKLKKEGIGTVQSVFVVNEVGKFITAISMDDLILEKPGQIFLEIVDKFSNTYSIASHESIDNVVNMIEKYDLTTLAVVDRKGHLIGRITHDDVVDIMQSQATKQIYNLNKIDADEEIQEKFSKTSKTRATWLTINLVNAILASLVIGIFETTLKEVVALAVLMPIVANMAGTASVQTMTVVVRQMALGEISFNDIRPIFIKEVNIAALNGILFGLLSAGAAQVWFENQLISLAIGLSMFISFISAGVLGALVPMGLKKLNLDPAVASSVVVITAVDIIGFFSFLWFAELIIL
ncbi:MAG: magnesium transporter [Helicobacteraceae bacterium]|nr:magnesium transporter [Candidatus Sulfurimonas ponti]